MNTADMERCPVCGSAPREHGFWNQYFYYECPKCHWQTEMTTPCCAAQDAWNHICQRMQGNLSERKGGKA